MARVSSGFWGVLVTTIGVGVAIELALLPGDMANKHPRWLLSGHLIVAAGLVGFVAAAIATAHAWCHERRPGMKGGEAAPEREIITIALYWLTDRSAWGRWARAFQLAKNDQEMSGRNFMEFAVLAIDVAIQEGRLQLWGVHGGSIAPELVPRDLLQTRRGHLWVERDDRQLWRVHSASRPK